MNALRQQDRNHLLVRIQHISWELRVFFNKIQPLQRKYLNPLRCVTPVSKTSLGNFYWGQSVLQLLFFFLNTIFTKTWEIKYDWKCWRKQFFRMNFLLLKASHHLSQYVVFMTVTLWAQSNECSSLTIFIKWHTKTNYTLEGQYRIPVRKVKIEVF